MFKKVISNLPLAFFVVALVANVAVGQQQRASTASAPAARSTQQNDATAVFRSARDLITDGEWAKAQEKFDEYVKSYPNEKNMEAALYWLAYAQHKMARFDQMRATVDRLLQKYPNSNWRDDARLLLAQAPGGAPAAEYDSLVQRLVGQATINPPVVPQIETMVYTPGVPSQLLSHKVLKEFSLATSPSMASAVPVTTTIHVNSRSSYFKPSFKLTCNAGS